MAEPQNFNTQTIVRARLNTLIKSETIPAESQSRIFVGITGGIAYKLFTDEAPYQVELGSLRKLETARNYIDATIQYIRQARTYASGYKFDLVSIDGGVIHNRTPLKILEGNNYSYSDLAIGDELIESCEKLAKFIKMIREAPQFLKSNHPSIKNFFK